MTSASRQNAETGGKTAAQSRPMFHRITPARPQEVRDTLADIRRRFSAEVSEDTLGRLELVLAEVMNNVAEHGQSAARAPVPSIHVVIVCHGRGLACAITDDGRSLPQECLLPRHLPQFTGADAPEGGFGWYLIQDLTQALCYYREEPRNFLAFNIPFADSPDCSGPTAA